LVVRHEGARTRRCSAAGSGGGGSAVRSGAGSSSDAGGDAGDAGAAGVFGGDEARDPAQGTPSPGLKTASQQLFDLIDDDARGEVGCAGSAGEGHHAGGALVGAAGAAPRQ